LLGEVTVGLVQAWRTNGEIEISAEEIAMAEKGLVAREVAA